METPESRSYNMSRIRSKDTGPEIEMRKALHALGYRFRKNVRELPGSPDIVLPKYRTAIFVNGCFWHGHEGCSKFVMPKTNVAFWENKIQNNRQRDILNCQRLEALAWNAITVWECELSKKRFSDTLESVMEQMTRNLASWESYKCRRKEDRQFAREQSRIRKELLTQIESDLSEQFGHQVHMSRSRIPSDELL